MFQYGAVAANFEGFGVLSLSVKSLSVGNIAVTTTSNPDGTGETFSPTELVAGISYSRMLTDAISVGLTVNYVTETLAEVSASGVSFDFGVIYNNLADINGLSIGVVAKNFGTEMTFGGTGLYQVVSEPPYNVNRYYSVNSAAFEMPFNFQLAAGYKKPLDAQNSLGVYRYLYE